MEIGQVVRCETAPDAAIRRPSGAGGYFSLNAGTQDLTPLPRENGLRRAYSRHVDDAELTLFIETDAGTMLRTIPRASPLRDDMDRGGAAEAATHDAAAVWGLPDFVYRAELRRVGSGSREIGDRLLLVGSVGVVVQVKCRHKASADPDKERRWFDKNVKKALAQANGTIRGLKNASARLTSARGRSIEIDGNTLRWIAVIVLEHPDAPIGIIPAIGESANPAVAILRRDWEFLFEQLKSTHAVCGYFERVASEAVELGQEPVRYFQLALADEQAPPGPLDPALLGAEGRSVSSPLLPLVPAASDDEQAHRLVRSIFEDIATSGLRQVDETDRVRALAELDRLPVSDRAEIGKLLINSLAAVMKTPAGTTEWRLRRMVGGMGGEQTVQLAFGACSAFSPEHQAAFNAWVQLRHYEVQQVIDDGAGLTTVGVLLTPRPDGQRPWDTTLAAVSGDLQLTPEELSLYREVWSTDEQRPAETI